VRGKSGPYEGKHDDAGVGIHGGIDSAVSANGNATSELNGG